MVVFLLVATTIIFTSLGYMILMLWFGKKSFSFHHFPHYWTPSMRQTWILIIISILLILGTTIMFSLFGYTILMLWLSKKSYSFHRFHYNQSSLWNETNLDTYYNLHSFCYWALQSCSPYWDTGYWCFDLARKSFLSIIVLIIKVRL